MLASILAAGTDVFGLILNSLTFATVVPEILNDISRVISFGVGRTNEERVEDELFDDGGCVA